MTHNKLEIYILILARGPFTIASFIHNVWSLNLMSILFCDNKNRKLLQLPFLELQLFSSQ